MGGNDNSKFKSLLLNFLQIVYNQPTPNNNWVNRDYNFQGGTHIDQISWKKVRGLSTSTLSVSVRASITMSPTQNTCIKFNFTNYEWGAAGIMLEGIGLYVLIPNHTREIIPHLSYYPYTFLNDPDRNASFNYGAKDIIEVQFEPQSYLIRYKKLHRENSQQASTYMQQETNYSKISFMGSVCGNQQVLQIAFPFMFSSIYKPTNFTILGHLHIQLNVDDLENYYFAQVEPSINQVENYFTLKFINLYQSRQVGLGVCDRDRVQKNNHISGQPIGLGVYLLFSNGHQWHNVSGDTSGHGSFTEKDIISVSYSKSNNSILYYKNSTFLHSFNLIDSVKNLNFCLTMNGYQSTVYLEY
ncbi:hypothetical protein pb186bvf_005096 [Paramecium bursaria]